jgi:hypothetical protein
MLFQKWSQEIVQPARDQVPITESDSEVTI